MKLRWSKAESEYFNKTIPTAEWKYEWIMWAVLAILSFAGLAYLVFGIIK